MNDSGHSFLIGIDGLGGLGKSTYAKELNTKIKDSILLHLDDFIYPKRIRYNPNYEEWYCYYQLQWRYDYLVEKLLNPLKNALSINDTIELYAKETDSYRLQNIQIPKGITVIIEGVFLQRPEIGKYFDKVIYMDLNRETRMKRVIERDSYIGNKEEIVQKYEKRYFPAEQFYINECNPLAFADIIIKK